LGDSIFIASGFTANGGLTWQFTYDNEGDSAITDWGIYNALGGVNELYLIGRNGYVTKWK
jgi:hypothetical protein